MSAKNVLLCAVAGRYRFAARRNPVEFGCAWGGRGPTLLNCSVQAPALPAVSLTGRCGD